MHRQFAWQPGRRPPEGEPVVDLPRGDPATPLGQPHRGVRGRLVAGPDLREVLLQNLTRPRHHRRDRTAPRWRAAHRLAEPHLARPQAAEFRCGRVTAEIGDIEHRDLPPTQAERVADLEQSGVPERRQPTFPAGGDDLLDPVVRGVEECLQLGPGQRTPRRAALVVGHVPGSVPLMADLHRARPDPLLALGDPPIPVVAHVLQKHRDRALITADRGMCPPTGGDPGLHLPRTPGPRPPAGELSEPADRPIPAVR